MQCPKISNNENAKGRALTVLSVRHRAFEKLCCIEHFIISPVNSPIYSSVKVTFLEPRYRIYFTVIIVDFIEITNIINYTKSARLREKEERRLDVPCRSGVLE